MIQMKELNQITNEVIKQSEELLEHLENDLEIEEIRQELVELKQQQSKVNKIMFSGVTMTAVYSILIVLKIIMTTIQ